MNSGMVRSASRVVCAMILVACGGSKPAEPSSAVGAAPVSSGAPGASSTSTGSPTPADAPASTTSAPSTGAAAPSASSASTAPAASAATPPPPAHPFAHNAEEATSLIDDAITSKSAELSACVDDARKRRKEPHAKIVVTIGIDENGRLIGVEMPKGEKKDKGLSECLLQALHGAPFPQSHAGVITVRRTFEDKAVYR